MCIRSIIQYLRACADTLLPRVCIICGKKLMLDEEHLCLGCRLGLPFTYYWDRTHNPMADKFNAILQSGLEAAWAEEGESMEICRDHERYAYACALFFYRSDAEFSRITQEIKYYGNISIGQHFGLMLGKRMAACNHFRDASMVIPVPLHWRRKWKRGYNQAEVIADAVAAGLGVPMRTDLLARTRHTKTQTRLDVAGKAANVNGAFKVRDTDAALGLAESSAGHIILVDDVFTTGATLNACHTALREVFPPSVRISVATLGFVGE